jgi:Malectin domain
MDSTSIVKMFLLVLALACPAVKAYHNIFAVNVGGDVHIDTNGISYMKDMSTQGIREMWQPSLNLGMIPESDRPLYKTFRWSNTQLSYEIPVLDSGMYVLIMKFANDQRLPDQRVFNVILNRQHIALHNEDNFQKAGLFGAYDEIVHFEICRNGKQLHFKNELSIISKHRIPLQFVTVRHIVTVDAFAVIKGHPGEVMRYLAANSTQDIVFPRTSHCKQEDQAFKTDSMQELEKQLKLVQQYPNNKTVIIINNKFYENKEDIPDDHF